MVASKPHCVKHFISTMDVMTKLFSEGVGMMWGTIKISLIINYPEVSQALKRAHAYFAFL